jgi:hypothetical protein
MKLFTKCPYCSEESSLHYFTTDRGSLAREKGKQLRVICKKCHSEFNCDVDNLYAKKSKLSIVIALLVLIIGMPGAFFGLNSLIWDAGYVMISTGMFAIPFMIYQIINAQDKKRVDVFNNFKINK